MHKFHGFGVVYVKVDRKRGKLILSGETPYIPAKIQVKKKIILLSLSSLMQMARRYTPLSPSLDPNFAAEITIWGADLTKPLWVLAGVDEDNWWNDFVPEEVQLVCSGSKLSGSKSSYCLKVVEKGIPKATDFVYIGSGIVAVASWLDKSPDTPRSESPEYPYGDFGMVAESQRWVSRGVRAPQR